MFGKRSVVARPVAAKKSKKRKTQRSQQPANDLENIGCLDTSKRVSKVKNRIVRKMVPEKTVGSKRKALGNISNIKKEHAKCQSEEKRKKRLCLRSVKAEDLHASSKVFNDPRQNEQRIAMKQEHALLNAPKNFEDIDELQKLNAYAVPTYAKAIFDNLKERENCFRLTHYMHKQLDIDIAARTVVVNWMVEMQENFALTHETLYLAVKLLDHYLSNHVCLRKDLQLVAVTAVLIAAKFVECRAPRVDALVYSCADAYPRQSILEMEKKVLCGVGFDINIPIAYSFIRRYSECAQSNLVTLTLARYICERTLQESDFLTERASLLAASSLLLAMRMAEFTGWTPALIYYTGYLEEQLLPLVKKLNKLISAEPHEKVKSVHTKYSDSTFLRVTLIPPLDPASFPND